MRRRNNFVTKNCVDEMVKVKMEKSELLLELEEKLPNDRKYLEGTSNCEEVKNEAN